MTEDTKITIETAEELTNFLMDLQGQIVNIQEVVDKLSPVEEEEPTEETEDTPAEEETEEVSEEELSEIDKLLQSK